MSRLKLKKDWFYVIPPLVNNINVSSEPKTKDTINLVFAGKLYPKIRNPSFLLKLINIVRKKIESFNIKLHFYGDIRDCDNEFLPYNNYIGDWIILHGMVKKLQLMDAYRNADILINIGNASRYQLPSKVVEYMSMGLPILNIHSIDEDLCVKTLHEYPASLSLLETKKITDKMINQVCDFFLDRPQVSPLVINNILKDYKTKVIADKYLIMLK